MPFLCYVYAIFMPFLCHFYAIFMPFLCQLVIPITQDMSMSPTIRTSPYGLFICALFPPKMKDPRWYILQLLQWLKSKGAFDGFTVWDAYTKRKRSQEFEFIGVVEDYRGCTFLFYVNSFDVPFLYFYASFVLRQLIFI